LKFTSLEVHKVSTSVRQKKGPFGKKDRLGYLLPGNGKGKSNGKINCNGMSNSKRPSEDKCF
jgi:hypothetical protein